MVFPCFSINININVHSSYNSLHNKGGLGGPSDKQMIASFFPDTQIEEDGDGDEEEEIDEEEEDGQEFEGEEQTQVQSSCPHSYAFVEPLSSDEPWIYREKWRCLDCSDERVLTIHTGVRDWYTAL
jgi:hypothetical protein